MIKLYNKQTGEFLGRVNREQWHFLANELEEEGLDDRDYYIRSDTLDSFERSGADPKLVDVLRAAMKPGQAIEVRWDEEA